MSNFHNIFQSLDRKRKVVVSMKLDETFDVEYFENGKLIHSYDAFNKTITEIQEQAQQFINYEDSPVLLEG